MKSLIERLYKKQTLSSEELHVLLENCDDYHLNLINKLAQTVAETHFGKKIFVRGLIEIGNCCHNNCYYCGIRSEIKHWNDTGYRKKIFWIVATTDTNRDSGPLSCKAEKTLL